MEIRNYIYNFSLDPQVTGSKIKNLRKSKKMTAEKFAEKLCRSVKTISSWETGARFPSIDALVDLANFFDTSVHSLMLPLDNCLAAPAPTFPSDYASNNPEDYIGDSSDERIATLFVRAEYLIQRMLCGVFTNKDKCEWEMVSFALMLPFDPKGNEYEKGNSLEAFWQLKKDHLYISSTKQILLNRILRGEHLSHSLKAMDLFERSVFFTVLCYYPEFRNWDCAKMLYDTGARFIDCQFSQNAEKIRQFALQKEQKHLFNIVTSTISSEEECQRFWGADTYSDEEGKDDWFSFLEVPRYKDDPDYYKDKTFRNIVYTKQDDPEHKTLAAYYSLFDFITDAISSVSDFGQKCINSDACFDTYLNTLLERGAIE